MTSSGTDDKSEGVSRAWVLHILCSIWGVSGGFGGQKGKDFPVKMCQGQGGKGGRG